MESSIRILLHKYNRRFCYFQEKRYICIELFDEIQNVAIQHSYIVIKFYIYHCYSGKYKKFPIYCRKNGLDY